ncbi:hypothetical protein FOZ63_007901, partial [Perkinsus olseni]
ADKYGLQNDLFAVARSVLKTDGNKLQSTSVSDAVHAPPPLSSSAAATTTATTGITTMSKGRRLLSSLRHCNSMVVLNSVAIAFSVAVLVMGIYISVSPLGTLIETWPQWCTCLYGTALLLISIVGCSIPSQTRGLWHVVYCVVSGLLLVVSVALIVIFFLDLFSLQKNPSSVLEYYKVDWTAGGCSGGTCTLDGCPTPLLFDPVVCDDWDTETVLDGFISQPSDQVVLACAGRDQSGVILTWCRSAGKITSELKIFVELTLSFILTAALLQIFCLVLNHIYYVHLSEAADEHLCDEGDLGGCRPPAETL